MPPRLTYRLPLSILRITGTRTQRVDTILEKSRFETEASAELAIAADPRGPLLLELDDGHFKDTVGSFKLTGDGRLTSASATVTGQGGTVLTGLVGIAT